MSDIRDDYLKFRVDDDISGSKDSFFGNIIKILIIVLLVLLLLIGVGFVYKYLFKDDTRQVSIQPENKLLNRVTTAVEAQTANQGGVKKEEIALIVKSIMEQMNKNKPQAKQPVQQVQKDQTDEEIDNVVSDSSNDATLLNQLSSTDADNVNDEGVDLSSLDNIDSNKQVKNTTKKADTFNKVIIDKKEVATKDDLSKLYAKLNSIMKKDKVNSKDTSYLSGLKQETKVRSNAMRIITVKRGDTLSLIAKRAYGNPMLYNKIYEANPDLIKNPNRIYIGQKLRVPK